MKIVSSLKEDKQKDNDKIYLNDLPLEDSANDKFQAIQVAEILKDSIQQSSLPLHISLLGKWGSGKTTVIKILKSLLQKSDYELKVISVWKFADDSPSLHRKIVREIERKLDADNPELLDISTTNERQIQSNGILSNLLLFKRLGDFKFITLIAAAIYIFLLIVFFMFPIRYQSILNSSILLALTGLFTLLISRNSFSVYSLIKNVRTNLPLNYNDQYENRFIKVVDNYLGIGTNKKLILVFDDLDRLPPKQLYGALNTIKTFLDSNRCAFIIPCDEEVLKRELNEAFEKKEMDDIFDVKEYLNKTFDITVRLPKLEPSNMWRYSQTLLENNEILWFKENKEYYKELLSILIHPEVLTPRHVKKNINTFATDWELAKKRDEVNQSRSFLTLHPREIAVFSVLKTDYSDFYNLIIENPFLVLDMYETSTKEKYRNKISNFDNLSGFLSRVEHILPEDPRPFIYFNNVELNPLTGRADLELLKKHILNGQWTAFKEQATKVQSSDLRYVFTSVFTDISSNLDCKNVFSIIFKDHKAIDVFDENDKIRLQELIRLNLNLITEHDIKESLQVFNKVVNHLSIWRTFGELIYNTEEKFLNLLQANIEFPDLVEKLQIKDISSLYAEYSVQIGEQAKDVYYVPNQILELPIDHPLVNSIPWTSSLMNCLSLITKIDEIEDEDEEIYDELYSKEVKRLTFGFMLSDWLLSVKEKTNQIIDVKIINTFLIKYRFIESNQLKGVVGVWLELFEDNQESEPLKDLISLIKTRYFNICEKYELKLLGDVLSNFNNDEDIYDEIYENLKARVKHKNNQNLLALLNYFNNTNAVKKFSLYNYDFSETELNEQMLNIIISSVDIYSSEDIETFMEKSTNNVFEQDQSTSNIAFLRLIRESREWLKLAREQKDTWFGVESEVDWWFKWSGTGNKYYDKLEIYFELYRDQKDVWDVLINSLERIIPYNDTPHNFGAKPYRGNISLFVNSAFKLIYNKCNHQSMMEQILSKLINVNSISNSNVKISIFEILDSDIISEFISKASNVISLSNNEFNQLIIKYGETKDSTHLSNIIKRWGYFSRDERIEFTSRIEEEKEILLVKHIEDHPELIYISELKDYIIEDEIKFSIMRAIIIRVDKVLLNQWLIESVNFFNEKGLSKWRCLAFDYGIQVRDDLQLPDLSDVEKLFTFKDDRTKIAIKLITKFYPRRDKNKAEIKEIRKRILILEDNKEFKELVYEAKDKFGWRNTILA
ncbi:P-loop NTPase fold protein [Ferdinandcohnia quinoae]|uniref:KAP family NTPase n=1 Tax=Fredinandcohnia quinoae TaxID=2918902 RepID=A0AAW5ECJ5_9BACI|nr:P-loop NTPase fold protein [Fredinandcohnia sp. SECRCQ15]MCH1627415.1 KAP family NTPase [Fredinandcohnia sp. SECRCQ15]